MDRLSKLLFIGFRLSGWGACRGGCATVIVLVAFNGVLVFSVVSFFGLELFEAFDFDFFEEDLELVVRFVFSDADFSEAEFSAAFSDLRDFGFWTLFFNGPAAADIFFSLRLSSSASSVLLIRSQRSSPLEVDFESASSVFRRTSFMSKRSLALTVAVSELAVLFSADETVEELMEETRLCFLYEFDGTLRTLLALEDLLDF